MFKNWFKKTVITPGVIDRFRIKLIVLNDGTNRYYAQYKESSISADWLNILLLADGQVILHEISNYDEEQGCLSSSSKEETDQLISKYKDYLAQLRSKQVKEVIYIKDL